MPSRSTPSESRQDRSSRSPRRRDNRRLQGQHHRSSDSHSHSRSRDRSRSESPLLSHRLPESHRRERDGESPAEEASNLRAKVRRLEHLIESGNELKSIKTLGRGFRRLVHLTDHPMVVADQAQIHMVAIRDNETLLAIRVLQEMDEKDRSNEQRAELAAWQVQERNLEAFWCFERLIPNLRKTITDSGPAYLRNFYATIKKGASEARSSDLSTVSKHVGVFLNERVPRPDPLLKTLGRDIRMNRGIEHDTCLRLMLPIDLEDTDETFRRIRDPTDTLDLRSSFFARLFYPDFTGNRENVKAGFLRSQLLVLLYQVVFTSPSSAGSLNVERAVQTRTRPSRAVRGPVADILHMGKHVTLQSITYISVLAYVALTNASQWYSAYNGMDYTAMYNFIIDSFQPGSEHLRELLEWWDRQIFGNTPQSDVTGATITQRSMQLLNAQ